MNNSFCINEQIGFFCLSYDLAWYPVFLQVEDPLNIKLSDYGISRQSFHEGALGVEGTPGYQAPEIRPGIVYDEKVMTSTHIN